MENEVLNGTIKGFLEGLLIAGICVGFNFSCSPRDATSYTDTQSNREVIRVNKFGCDSILIKNNYNPSDENSSFYVSKKNYLKQLPKSQRAIEKAEIKKLISIGDK